FNYREENGGFTSWGHGDPDLALTAYALRFLTQANELTAVDDDVIKQARVWLVKQQRADGSWAGYNYDKKEDKNRTAMLTAYVARILAMTAEKTANKSSQQMAPELRRAFDYLAARTDEINETFL